MTLVYCSIPEQFVNPLFEVFDGGDFILSSYRSVEAKLTDVQIYFEERAGCGMPGALCEDAKRRLRDALDLVGVKAELFVKDVPDEDWKYAYRRHFKTERLGKHIITHPEWEPWPETKPGDIVITLDPGLAFGTGKHETTRACLEYIDEVMATWRTGGAKAAAPCTFLDMGTGSGILSIAARKLGATGVRGFDVDPEAVEAAEANAKMNGVAGGIEFFRYGLGKKGNGALGDRALPQADLVAANILGPLLIRFADEIVPTVRKHLIISGILTELYPEVLRAFVDRGLEEVSRRTIGEWTTGLLCLKQSK